MKKKLQKVLSKKDLYEEYKISNKINVCKSKV